MCFTLDVRGFGRVVQANRLLAHSSRMVEHDRRGGRVLVGVFALALVADVATATCSTIVTRELPRLGGLRGTWIDEEAFVLADLKRARLLVFDVHAGFERTILGSGLGALTFQEPVDVTPWDEGLVLADSTLYVHRLLALSATAEPEERLWQVEWRGPQRSGHIEPQWRFSLLSELVSLKDRLYLLAQREGELIVQLAPAAGGSGFRQVQEWPALPDESIYWNMPGVRILAATEGAGGSVYALRFQDGAFVQELAPRSRRLDAFARPMEALPVLPQGGLQVVDQYTTVLEAGSYPAGLYASGDHLFLLTKTAEKTGPVWDLHRIDPRSDRTLGKSRLPTRATHVSLLPGRRQWLLEESSSRFEDMFRQPKRLLLLDAVAVRTGEPLAPCE